MRELFTCDCKRFERVGTLCRHIFTALKAANIYRFPKAYALARWCKDAVKKQMIDEGGIDSNKVLTNDIWFAVQSGIRQSGTDSQKLKEYFDGIANLNKSLFSNGGNVASSSRNDIIAEHIGCTRPVERIIQNPKESRNKGCGRRLKSGKEKALEQHGKDKRICSFCKKAANHDKRNCPERMTDN